MGAPFITVLPTFTHEDMGYLVSYFTLWLLVTVGASTLGFRTWKGWYDNNSRRSRYYFWVNPNAWTIFYFFLLPTWILAGFLDFYSGEVYFGDEIDPSVSNLDERVWFTGVAFHLLSCCFIVFWANLFLVVRNRLWTLLVGLLACASIVTSGIIFWVQFAWAGGFGTLMTLGAFVYMIILLVEISTGGPWEMYTQGDEHGDRVAYALGNRVADGISARAPNTWREGLEEAGSMYPSKAKLSGSAFLPNEYAQKSV